MWSILASLAASRVRNVIIVLFSTYKIQSRNSFKQGISIQLYFQKYCIFQFTIKLSNFQFLIHGYHYFAHSVSLINLYYIPKESKLKI